MPRRKQHSGPPVPQAKVSRRQAREAREQLAAGGLSHQERRRLRSLIRARDAVAGGAVSSGTSPLSSPGPWSPWQ